MTEEQEAEVQRLIKDIDVTELMGDAHEAWQPIFQENLKVLPVVLQVYASLPYVLSRLWYLEFFPAST